ncbi:MAG: hypothetical protein A2W91_03475 [Bacteroidetes bacterium GWF2_38_335]|nr:MAG: hypothetical protein A2W91_03475 [Bacteroidetes bacterium GWF2_38_335]OFY77456.1 MAG: hypothetical protein A2281_01285 [Bacteroidetes bacterium RIFOXYA12_FULL_38_20]HBS87255.1 alpha/beta hydrolase [Bacteroidales bacterium]
MGFVSVNNKIIHFQSVCEEYYNESTLFAVFLHEGLGSVELWKDFPGKVCSALKLPGLVYDRYGYGKSEGFSEERSIGYLEEEAKIYLPELIRKLSINNPLLLIGHSDGASIALIYAGLNRNIAGVVSIAAHVFIEDESRNGIHKAIHSFENANLKKQLEKYHGTNTDSMFYGWAKTWISENSFDWNIEHYLNGIACPVLIIQGTEDQYGTRLQIDSIASNSGGNNQVLFIPDCGHAPHFENENLMLESIKKFHNVIKNV